MGKGPWTSTDTIFAAYYAVVFLVAFVSLESAAALAAIGLVVTVP